MPAAIGYAQTLRSHTSTNTSQREKKNLQIPIAKKPNFTNEELSELIYARILFDRAKKLKKQGNLHYGHGLAEKSANIVAQIYGPQTREHARCVNLVARFDCALKNYELAENSLEQIQTIMAPHRHGNPWGLVRIGIDCDLAFTKRMLGKLAEAEVLYQKALKEYDKTKGPRSYAMMQIKLGELYWDMGNPAPAMNYINDGYNLIEKHSAEEEDVYIAALISLGKSKYLNKEYTEAERIFRRALKLLHATGNGKSLRFADASSSLAKLRIDRNQFQAATELMEEALSIREQSFGKEHKFVQQARKEILKLKVK